MLEGCHIRCKLTEANGLGETKDLVTWNRNPSSEWQSTSLLYLLDIVRFKWTFGVMTAESCTEKEAAPLQPSPHSTISDCGGRKWTDSRCLLTANAESAMSSQRRRYLPKGYPHPAVTFCEQHFVNILVRYSGKYIGVRNPTPSNPRRT